MANCPHTKNTCMRTYQCTYMKCRSLVMPYTCINSSYIPVHTHCTFQRYPHLLPHTQGNKVALKPVSRSQDQSRARPVHSPSSSNTTNTTMHTASTSLYYRYTERHINFPMRDNVDHRTSQQTYPYWQCGLQLTC